MSKVSKIHCTDFNALNAMYVREVGDGVCGFYATLYAEYRFHVEDIEDYKTDDKKLHCIVLSLFYFMSKTLEMCTNVYEL